MQCGGFFLTHFWSYFAPNVPEFLTFRLFWFVPPQEFLSVIPSPLGALGVAHLGGKREVVLKCVIMAAPRGNVSPVIRKRNVQEAQSQGSELCSLPPLQGNEVELCAFHSFKPLFTAVLG